MKYSLFLTLIFLGIASSNDAPLNMVDANKINHVVRRVGILPVKDYGVDDIHGPGSRYAAILGVARHNRCAGPFSGQCDASDNSVWDAAARECVEETSGALDLRGISPLSDVYFSGNPTKGPQNALFVFFNNDVRVTTITERNRSALRDSNLSHCWKENDHAIAIDFPTLHALLTFSISCKIQKHIGHYLAKNSSLLYPHVCSEDNFLWILHIKQKN